MKKETFFFLIFILAGSIITGSTLGMISNMQYMNKTGKLPNANQIAKKVQVTEKGTSAHKVNVSQTASDNSSVTVSQTSAGSTSENMVMSPEETGQIKDMLTKLGMAEGSNYEQFVKEYQQAHGINPTGNMDSMTLNSIIEEVKIQRTKQLVAQ